MSGKVADEPVISLKNVTFSYGGEPVLEDVTFSIDACEAACVVGPNGGGKTTLMKLILGVLKPDRGEIRVFGLPPRRARLRIGYMPQHAQYDPQFPVTVMDIVLMGRLGQRGWAGALGWHGKVDHREAMDALAQVDLADFGRRPFASLSGGQRQRVMIARALCCKPDLLLLDEPTANVDSLVETHLLELLKKLNRDRTIIMVTHDLGFVSSLVERAICVNRRVIVHPTSQITGDDIRDIYGGDVRRVRHHETSLLEHSHE